MASIREIEQNTDYLSDDIVRLEDEKNKLERAIDEMFDAVNTLEATWDGPASETFKAQFQSDYETCKEMHRAFGTLIEKLKTAKEEYDRCESEVGELVRSIRV